MRDIVDQLRDELSRAEQMLRVKVDAYGPVTVIPDDYPYVNILPRSKRRSRVYYLGITTKEYNTNPEIEIHVFHASTDSLREAFYRCETLAETVQALLAAVPAATFGVDYHESQIETYDQGQYERGFIYRAVILWAAKTREAHT